MVLFKTSLNIKVFFASILIEILKAHLYYEQKDFSWKSLWHNFTLYLYIMDVFNSHLLRILIIEYAFQQDSQLFKISKWYIFKL